MTVEPDRTSTQTGQTRLGKSETERRRNEAIERARRDIPPLREESREAIAKLRRIAARRVA
jgi:hypothetical protein